MTSKYVQDGGALIFETTKTTSSLIKYDQKTQEYERIRSDGNQFTNDTKLDIEFFVNFVIPHIINPDTKKPYGFSATTRAETLFGGSFGVAVCVDNLLLKFMPHKKLRNVYEELINALEIFTIADYVPPQINKIYGFFTRHDEIFKQTYAVFPNVRLWNKMLYTNYANDQLDTTAFNKSIRQCARTIREYKMLNTSVLLMEKSVSDMYHFNFNYPLQVVKVMYDVSVMINFLFGIKKIHFDIKRENIVFTYHNNELIFQLIDFGGLSDYDQNGNGLGIGGKGSYILTSCYSDSFTLKINVRYDGFCSLCAILEALNICVITSEGMLLSSCDGINLPQMSPSDWKFDKPLPSIPLLNVSIPTFVKYVDQHLLRWFITRKNIDGIFVNNCYFKFIRNYLVLLFCIVNTDKPLALNNVIWSMRDAPTFTRVNLTFLEYNHGINYLIKMSQSVWDATPQSDKIELVKVSQQK